MMNMMTFQRAMTAAWISFLQTVAGCIQMIVIGHLGINVYEELKYKMLSNLAVSFLFKLRPSELEVGSSRYYFIYCYYMT